MIVGRHRFLIAVLGALLLAGCVVGLEEDVDSLVAVSQGLEEPVTCDPPAPEAAGCCPGTFELMDECAVFAIAEPGFESVIERADANADNHYCIYILRGGRPIFDPAFIYMDNKVPSPSQNCEP